MKYNLYVTQDVISGETKSGLIFAKNDEEAKRAFGYSCKQIKNTPEDNQRIPVSDLKFYRVGTFDTETMDISASKEYLASGAEF